MKHFYYDNKGNLLKEVDEPDIDPIPISPPPPPSALELLTARLDYISMMGDYNV